MRTLSCASAEYPWLVSKTGGWKLDLQFNANAVLHNPDTYYRSKPESRSDVSSKLEVSVPFAKQEAKDGLSIWVNTIRRMK